MQDDNRVRSIYVVVGAASHLQVVHTLGDDVQKGPEPRQILETLTSGLDLSSCPQSSPHE